MWSIILGEEAGAVAQHVDAGQVAVPEGAVGVGVAGEPGLAPAILVPEQAMPGAVPAVAVNGGALNQQCNGCF